MQLYDIGGLGYHTPLTARDIAKLVRAGRLHRESKCKVVDGQSWRTVDELFPLLKYDSSGQAAYWRDEYNEPALSFRHIVLAVVATLAVAIGAFAVFLFCERSITAVPLRQAATAPTPVAPTAVPLNTTSATALPANQIGGVSHATPPSFSTPHIVQAPRSETFHAEANGSLLEEQRRREQEQHDRAMIADRMRAQNDREATQRRHAAGRDLVIPLDTDVMVDVAGSSVRVRVHDNDVTSFDVWINGAHYRNLKKQKGITGSGTDETLIYSRGGTALYYAWEISGKLNHCHLRVR